MLKCEKCHERAATFFIKRVLDSKSTQSQFCEECAREHLINEAWLSGAPIPEDAAEMPLEDLLTELLTSAPDPDAFAPDEEKWSLPKLAAYDQLQATGEFSGDEDLADEADEMDDEPSPFTPEELQESLESLDPSEREAVSQMLEALDEVQEHLQGLMHQRAQDRDDADHEADFEDEGDEQAEDEPPHSAPTPTNPFFTSQLMLPPGGLNLTPPGSFEDDDADDEEDLDEEDEEDEEASEESGNPVLPSFLLPEFFGFSEFAGVNSPPSSEPEPEWKSAPSERCPKCRTTWDRLRQDGRAGCSSCYEAFAEALSDSLQQVQEASQHTGKSPRAALRRQKRLDLLRARRDRRLSLLRSRLKAAVKGHKAEEAEKLRAQIKIIESTFIEPEGAG